MKRKILLTVAVILTVMLSACGMSEEEIGTALSNINNEYQSGTYEQAQEKQKVSQCVFLKQILHQASMSRSSPCQPMAGRFKPLQR